MHTYNVYRVVKRQPREYWLSKRPTKVASIEADTAYDAALKFCDSLYRKKGTTWKDRVLESNTRRDNADLWMRKFTPSGRYSGETHFLIWRDENKKQVEG